MAVVADIRMARLNSGTDVDMCKAIDPEPADSPNAEIRFGFPPNPDMKRWIQKNAVR